MKKRLDSGERVNPVTPVHVWQSPPTAGARMVVVTRLEVYAAIHAHAVESLPQETGGFLLGRVAYDEQGMCWLLEIDETMPVEPLVQDVASFSFTWRDVDRVRSHREHQQNALLGWYHTHPNIGVFLSDTDVEQTHRLLFAEPFQVALVYDPVRGRAGYFFWEGTQTIDTTEARWREFVIATAPEGPAEESGGEEDEAAGPAPAETLAPPPDDPAGPASGHADQAREAQSAVPPGSPSSPGAPDTPPSATGFVAETGNQAGAGEASSERPALPVQVSPGPRVRVTGTLQHLILPFFLLGLAGGIIVMLFAALLWISRGR
jgi:proteasome lid subunit RPN8/RPN11